MGERNSGRLTSVAFVTLILLQAFAIAFYFPSPATAQTAGTPPEGYVQIRAIGSYGSWFPTTETPAQVEAIVGELHRTTGRNITIFSLVDGPELPSDPLTGWDGTVDSYLAAIKTEAGGDIIPTLDLDYYMSGSPWLTHSYCDPNNSTDCGPSFFYKMSAELLNLSAIGTGNREVLLDSWDTMSRYESQSLITGVLQNLTDQGWRHLIMKEEKTPSNPFPDYGYASYMAGVLDCSLTAPYCNPVQGKIDAEYANEAGNPNFMGVFGLFDYQIINSPSPQTAFDLFATNLTTDQQASALSNLASLQSSGRYVMSYPVLLDDSRDGVKHVFDASALTLSNGTSMLEVIESLIVSATQSTSTTITTTGTATNTSTNTTTTSTLQTSSTNTSSLTSSVTTLTSSSTETTASTSTTRSASSISSQTTSTVTLSSSSSSSSTRSTRSSSKNRASTNLTPAILAAAVVAVVVLVPFVLVVRMRRRRRRRHEHES